MALSGSNAASATEWRTAGEAPAPTRSVIVRRDGVPAQQDQRVAFDPFGEPLTDADASMPAAEPTTELTTEPAEDPGFDPFEHNTAQVRQPAMPVAEPVREPAREIDREALPEPVRTVEPTDEQNENFDIEQAFGAPRVGVSIGPSVEEEVDRSQDAADEEMDRRDRDDRDEAPVVEQEEESFTTEDALDAPERDADETEELVVAQNDEEFDADDFEGQFQQAPGGFDIRPMDGDPQATAEEAARRQAVEDQQIEAARIKSAETCEEFLAAVKADDIRTVSLSIRLEGRPGEDYPFDCGFSGEQFQPRSWAQTTYLWKASGLCHKPLYFEQVQLERYGHSWGPALDPLVAGAHFFGSVPLLPYKMGLMTPNECVYTLGYYRPGSCAPFMIPAVPFTWRAAAFEAGVWTGGAIAIP